MTNYTFATANLSFSFALGKKIGSEKKWLEKIAKKNPNKDPSTDKDFLKKKAEYTMELIAKKFIYDNLNAIGLQELNEYNNEIGIKTFEKAFKKVSKDVNNFQEVNIDVPEPKDDYEVNIIGIGKYCIISFGTIIPDIGVPTVALIYDIKNLGIPIKIFCEDCKVAGQNGRPMLGVITNMGFGLISMHAPNVNQYLLLNKNNTLRQLMDGENMHQYFIRESNENIEPSELSRIKELINSEFMTPMVSKITNFITKLNTNKIVLMGDMNDAYPNDPLSLSNKLKQNLGLEFHPGKPTCCYNWDSSKTDENRLEYTKWIFGHGHPNDQINKMAIPPENLNDVMDQKSQKKNYDFTGDLIYFTNQFKLVGSSQVQLFPQHDDKETSQYSDHVFQKITLSSNSESFETTRLPSMVGGKRRKHTKKRKSKKVKKSIKRRRSTKRTRYTKRR